MASYSGVRNAIIERNKKIDEKLAADGRAYDAQRQDITDNASNSLQQIFLQKERAEQYQKQQQKAAGITGGAAESANIALQANYATNRTNAMLERDQQLSNVNIQEDQARSQAEIDKSSNLVEMEQGQLAFDQDAESRAFDREQFDFSKKQFDYEKQRDHESDLWEMIRAGVVTQSMANELNMSYATLKELARRYKEN